MVGTDLLENTDTSDDKENLEQKICDLETELEGYRNFILQPQKHSRFSEAIVTVLCGTEGAQDGLSKSKGSADEEETTFSSLRQVRYVKHMKILHPLAPKMVDGGTLESLGQQLVGQESELQKEQNLNMELFGGIHNLQNKTRDLSPSRYVHRCLPPHCHQASAPGLERGAALRGHWACAMEAFMARPRQLLLGKDPGAGKD